MERILTWEPKLVVNESSKSFSNSLHAWLTSPGSSCQILKRIGHTASYAQLLFCHWVPIGGTSDSEEGALEPWNEFQAEGPDTESIGLWNRYLTPVSEAGMTSVPFAPGVDPAGILESMAQGDASCSYVHTDDNDVRYYAISRSGKGTVQYAERAIGRPLQD